MANKANAETVAPKVSKFSRDQLINSERYREKRDLLSVLLEDGKLYSRADVEREIERFMKGEVK